MISVVKDTWTSFHNLITILQLSTERSKKRIYKKYYVHYEWCDSKYIFTFKIELLLISYLRCGTVSKFFHKIHIQRTAVDNLFKCNMKISRFIFRLILEISLNCFVLHLTFDNGISKFIFRFILRFIFEAYALKVHYDRNLWNGSS